MRLPEIVAAHAPYLSKRSDNKLCLRCLDDATHGEFATVEAWADHLATEITKAGWRRTSDSQQPAQSGALF